MTEHKSRTIFKGAFILTVAGLISKILSAGYRVPLQNITGDLGFYIYQQVYPILGIAVILSLYGFPAAISKLVSEISEEHKTLSFPSFFIPVFLWMAGICGLIFIIGYSQASTIAAVMGDMKLVPSLRSAFFVFLLVPFVSLLRGVFQGGNQMGPTASSQIIEQLIRVSIIIATAVWVMRSERLYAIGIGASTAALAGALGAILVLVLYARKHQVWSYQRWESSISYIKTILFYGLFICFNYMMLLSLQLVDAFTLVRGLIDFGIDLESARVSKGIFDRGQPLIQLGTVLASSIALALIPSVTKPRLKKNPELVKGYMFTATKFSLVVAAGATVGLIVLFPEINRLFFQSEDGTQVLRLLSIVILFTSLAITTSSILQGLGYVTHTAFYVLAAILFKTLCNLWLIPYLGLEGAAAASLIAVVFVWLANVITLRKHFPIKKWLELPWSSIVIASIGMIILLMFLRILGGLVVELDHRAVLLFYTLSLTGIGATLYFVLLFITGAFTKAELKQIPFHDKWGEFLPKGRIR
ncbi:polysaccharide biosynthesis protein [Halobacillus yeomjeoni]|uniref:putative polysaccharide biosynthesis protein n=1 Tax=Halobacillus yeomjeoni TaxID=311194 RepID=UPI001CD460DF|nr:polysaccharide biosynthesis protein [Halobacillus yeomjeoni]MCA0985629.1 polysaccharide biosynthesis protein [Halobacillus yeomjeoni]